MIWLENLILDLIYLSCPANTKPINCQFNSNKIDFLSSSYSVLHGKKILLGVRTAEFEFLLYHLLVE